MDCTNYNDERCPKNISLENIDLTDKDTFNSIFLGCWGVYCKEGEHIAYKYKKREFKKDTKFYGQGYVIPDMVKYSNTHQIDAVILAGDNVYGDVPDRKLMERIQETGDSSLLFNIEKQLREGFEDCMSRVNSDNFIVGIGNHDIESCHILNTQLNYTHWNMPALSFNIIYQMSDFYINFIFIDTNMYETDKWCWGTYPENAKTDQYKWVDEVLHIKYDMPVWNIVIGHIPFICNSHKENNIQPRIEVDLYKLILDYSHKIDLYMCADEHNQQYITMDGMPPQVISGSGGADLDRNVYVNELELQTQLIRSVFGFVGFSITKEEINLTFYTAQNQPMISEELLEPKTFIISKN